jgi:hypothetical protein
MTAQFLDPIVQLAYEGFIDARRNFERACDDESLYVAHCHHRSMRKAFIKCARKRGVGIITEFTKYLNIYTVFFDCPSENGDEYVNV